MDRLPSELHRLYLARPDGPPALIDGAGAVRAMVLALARPPSWELLGRAWHGVQAELALPAPAIAVSGVDALQLWFSLEAAVPAARAHAFLERLRLRFLAEVDAARVSLLPSADATHHAPLVPAKQEGGENWSAFVAPDLAPVFVETPWLDLPPGSEGQAGLLRGLAMIDPPTFESAFAALEVKPQPKATPAAEPVAAVMTPAGEQDPRRFLLGVMNDASVPLALRIEAAKALLQPASNAAPAR